VEALRTTSLCSLVERRKGGWERIRDAYKGRGYAFLAPPLNRRKMPALYASSVGHKIDNAQCRERSINAFAYAS
jgi:hypothetical protein